MINKINLLFVVILFISVLFHIHNRNDHFQEIDSSWTYYSLKDFLSASVGINYAKFFDENGKDNNKLITKNIVTALMDKPYISNTLKNIFKDQYNKETKEKIIDAIEKISFFWYFRLWLSLITYKISNFLPWISDGFKLALTTTYSFGPWLIYWIANYNNSNYDIFMSRNLIITILIFHLGVLLLYLTLLNLRLSKTSALLASLMMLFSISFYSYSYHLWSSIRNASTMLAFFYCVICFYEQDKFYKKISILTAILVFFNYLIIFARWALMLSKLYQSIKTEKTSKYNWSNIKDILIITYRNTINIIKEQKIALIWIITCGILFFNPVATEYLINSIESIPWFWKHFIDLYYIILNWTSIYGGNKRINMITFIISFWLILMWYILIFKNRTKHWKWINIFIKSFIILLFFVFLCKILVFIPTRHILFLAPLVFVPIALAIDSLTRFLKNRYIIMIFTMIFVGAWSFCVYDRTLKTYDILLKQKIDYVVPYENTIILDYNWSSLWYTNRYSFLEKSDKTRHFINLNYNFFSFISRSKMKKWQRYFYIGKIYNLSSRLKKNNLKDTKYKIYNEKTYSSDVYFLANNKWTGSPYPGNFSNTVYLWEFEILE